jgi:hypothetical protein
MNQMQGADDSDLAGRFSSRKTPHATWQVVTLWSVGLLNLNVIFSFLIILVGPFVLAPFFPNGRFAVHLFRCLPFVWGILWLAGTVQAYRRHRSFKVLGYLTAVGCVLLLTSPVMLFLIIIASVGLDFGK